MSDKIVSPSGKYELDIQDDGNLVVYSRSGRVIWTSGKPDPNPEQEPLPLPNPPLSRLVGGFRSLQLATTWGRFQWRGITAFSLLADLSQGKDINPILDFYQQEGINVVRTLSMCSWLSLHPSVGERMLIDLLPMCKRRGIYVEVVGLADTKSFPGEDLFLHLDHLAGTLGTDGNGMLEIANEPYHETQFDTVPAICLAYKPTGCVYAQGASASDVSAEYSGGTYITVHYDRTDAERHWRHVRHVKQGEELSELTQKFVVDDEPTKSDPEPLRWRAKGLLSTIFGVGSTFHYDGGKWCKRPEGAELESLRAWMEGLKFFGDVDRDAWLFTNTGWISPQCPVKDFDGSKIQKVFGIVNGSRGYVVLTDVQASPDNLPITMAGNWGVTKRTSWGSTYDVDSGCLVVLECRG